jgi:branched-chain amino acid transport system substrate-binding protein
MFGIGTMRILPSLLSVSLVFGCSAWALEPVKIGLCVPLSGRLAEHGHGVLRGVKVAHRMRPCVLGRPVALKVANDHDDLGHSSAAALALVERHNVSAIIRGLNCEHASTCSDYAEKRGVPIVAPFITSGKASQGRQCVFQTCAIDRAQACLAEKVARICVKARTAALVYDISRESSLDRAACFKNAFERAGGRIAFEQRMKTGDRDFTTLINRIKAAKPDTIYAPISPTECALLALQARLMAVHAPMIAAHEVQIPEFIALGGKAVENLLFTTHVHESALNAHRAKRFAAAYQFHTGDKPLPDHLMAAEAYFLLLDAMEQAGSDLPTLVGEALSSVRNWEGMTGKVCIGAGSGMPRPVFVSQVRNGQFVPYEELLRK